MSTDASAKTNVPSDMDGPVPAPSGAEVIGGDLTAPRDAGEDMAENLAARNAEQKVWAQQQSGEIDAQTVDLRPSPGNPEEGLPHAQTGEKRDTVNETDATSEEKKTIEADETVDTARAAAEHDERYLRLAADFENYKRQAARREAEGRERAARSVLEDLLPVLDNFERAVDAARNAKDVDSVRVGVEFIAQQFREALKNHGVEPIPAVGEKFDPLRHDALEEISGSDHPEGTVVEEAQRGYSYKGTVLRPSSVRVAGK